MIVRSDLETVGDGRKVATQFFDQLGRVRLSKTLEDAATQSPYNETDGIKVQTRYKTVEGYTYQLSSNPYRAATSSGETDATMGWTLATGWSHGRRSEVETFTGSSLPAAFGGNNTNSTGIVRTDIDTNTTTVTDQAGKQRRSITNALGQLIRVDEPNDAGQLETVASPNQATSYAYDTLNNLTTVTQGVQTRSFTYNSLSRLLSATNPESGTISYQYDPNGNLTSKTDARSITTTYAYDALNRVTQRSYSDSTPAVSYFYDNLTNAKGKLTKVTSSVSTTEYTSFDILGRVTGHKQTTDGTAYLTGYAYNLSGAMVEQVYPSGRVVKNVLDANGDLSMVQSKKNAAAGFWNYAENFTYNPAGAVTSMQLGNGKWESTQFNSRLQPTQIGLGSTLGATNLLKLDYEYGASGSVNNGNITKQTITVPTVGANVGFTAVQDYTYDSLNRLKSAVENVTPHGGSAAQSWKQTYTFDRYGNRRFAFTSGNTTFPDPNCPEAICNPTISTSNNRLTSTGWSYDSAGNTTNDPQGRTFIYDAENKQTDVRDQYNTVIGQYRYDGDGKRVKKIVPATGEVTVFVYDASGKSIAEYSTVVEPVETAKVAYLTADHLGSPRINTDRDGNVTSRRDFMPFGEQIYTSQRTMELGYDSDTVRRNFTTYERDQETDLDFAKARMYRSDLGRFSSPDYFAYDTSIAAPQSWNLYQYARNNPVLYKDPGGKDLYINIGGKDYKVARSDQAFVLVGNDGSDSDVVSAQSMVYRMAERYRREINELINNPSTTRISIGFTDEKWNVGSIRGPNPTQSANEDGDIVNLLNIQATLSLYRGDADGSFVIFATETLLAHLLTRENMFSATTGQLADGSLDRGALMNDGSMPVRHDELFRGFEVVVREAYRLPLIEPFTRFATEVRVVESFTDRYVPFDASPGPAGHLGQPARPDRQVSAGPCYGLSGAVIPCN